MYTTLENATTGELVSELVKRGAIATNVGCDYSEYQLTRRYSNDREPMDAFVIIIPDPRTPCKSPAQE
jgi:hypothetical protein